MLYINQTVNTNLEIKSLMDLTKLKALLDDNLDKLNPEQPLEMMMIM